MPTNVNKIIRDANFLKMELLTYFADIQAMQAISLV